MESFLTQLSTWISLIRFLQQMDSAKLTWLLYQVLLLPQLQCLHFQHKLPMLRLSLVSCFCSGTYSWILTLRQVFQQNIQFQPSKCSGPNAQQGLCYSTSTNVPQECWPKDSHQHGPKHSQEIWQCLLPELAERAGPFHLRPGFIHGHKV